MVEKSKADLESSRIEAEKLKVEADAKAYSLETEAKAKAKALEIEGAAIKLNPEVIKLRAVNLWDGKLPTIIGEPGILLNGVIPGVLPEIKQ